MSVEVIEANNKVVLDVVQSDQIVQLDIVPQQEKTQVDVISNVRYFTDPSVDFSPAFNQANAAYSRANSIYLKANTFMFRTLSVEEPTANDKIPFFFTSETITLKSLIPGIIGTYGNVTFSIRYGPNINSTGNEIITNGININTTNNGTVFTTFDNTVISANNYLWVTIPYANTTTQWLNLTLNY